ncbi:cytochrome P450 family protein [Xylaria grammica]|nr:cytochrome P450 family protein [Xylaria grammica]
MLSSRMQASTPRTLSVPRGYFPRQCFSGIDGQDTTSGSVGRLSLTEESAANPKFPDTLCAPGLGHKHNKYVESVKALSINSFITASYPTIRTEDIIKRSQKLEDNARKLEEVFEATPTLNLSAFWHSPFGHLCLIHLKRENVNSFLHPAKFNLDFSWVLDLIRKLPSSIEQRFIPSGIGGMIRFRTGIRQEVQKIPSSNDNDALNAAGSRGLASRASMTLAKLKQLSYLNAVIQEAHRFGFDRKGRNARVRPDKPMRYNDEASWRRYTFPPGTSVSISTLLVHVHQSVFSLGPAGAACYKYQLAFSKGPHACIGMHPVNAEVARAIAALARYDMKLFKTGNKDVAFLYDYHVATPKLGSKGVRVNVIERVEA